MEPFAPLVRLDDTEGVGMAVAREVFERRLLASLGGLLGLARRLTRNDADAEDLVAESVVRAWRAWTSWNEAALRGWLFASCTILRQRLPPGERASAARGDRGRRRMTTRECWLFERMHQPFLLWFSNPEQAFLDKLLREDLERALESLSEDHRIVVILADLEEFNYGEIAAALGVPLGTVRSRLSRARAALQKLLWQQAQDHGLHGEAATRRPPFMEGRNRDPARYRLRTGAASPLRVPRP